MNTRSLSIAERPATPEVSGGDLEEVMLSQFTPPVSNVKAPGNHLVRMLMVFLCSVLATFSAIALAQPYPVTLTATQQGLVIRAENTIRFYVDYSTRTILLPEATLSETARPAEGSLPGVTLEMRPEGLMLKTAFDFTLALSPNGKALTLNRPETTVEPANPNDARVPVFFYLSNAQPSSVAGLLTRLYPSLRVEVDERQRALVVLLNPTDRPVIESLIKQFDTPRPQVMFEAEILEVNRTLSQQLGIDYTKLINLNFKFVEATPSPGKLLDFAQFSRAPLSLEAGIQLLKSTGAGKTLARPRVATLDGLEAKVEQLASATSPLVSTCASFRKWPRINPSKQASTLLSQAQQVSLQRAYPHTQPVRSVPWFGCGTANLS
jgi:general secretion pathway protein D